MSLRFKTRVGLTFIVSFVLAVLVGFLQPTNVFAQQGAYFTQDGEMKGLSCEDCHRFPLPTDQVLATATTSGDFDGDGVNDVVFLTGNQAIKVFDANDRQPRTVQLGAPTYDQEHTGPKPYPKGHFAKGGEMNEPVRIAAMITGPTDDDEPGNHGMCSKPGNGKAKGKGKDKNPNRENHEEENDNSQSAADCDSSDVAYGEWPTATFAVGAWNGFEEAIFFTNQEHDKIYRVRPGDSVAVLAKPHNGVNAVVGFGDLNSDGQKELVFLDAGQNLRYMEEKDVGFHKSFSELEMEDLSGPGANSGIGVGAPVDFNGDGIAGVPVVTKNNDLAMVYADGDPRFLGTSPEQGCNCAAKASPTATDIDSDQLLELVFLGKSSGRLGYIDDDGVTLKPVQDSSGAFRTADRQNGLGASFAAEFLVDRDTSPLEQTDNPRLGLQFTQSSSIKKLDQTQGNINNLSPDNIEVLATNTAVFQDEPNIFYMTGKNSFGIYQLDSQQNQLNQLPNPADVENTLFGVGKWGGNLRLAYAGQNNDVIFGLGPNQSGVLADPANGVSAVAGFGDIGGGAGKELVFVDASESRNLRVVTLSQVGSGEKTFPNLTGDRPSPGESDAIGSPGDFDGDGKAAIPIVDENNSVALLEAGESPHYLGLNQAAGCDCAEKSSVAPSDIDNDGKTEFVFIDKEQHNMMYFENRGSAPQPVLDAAGDTILTDTSTLGPISRIGEFDTPDAGRSDTIVEAARQGRYFVRSGGFAFTDGGRIFQMGAETLIMPTFGLFFSTKTKPLEPTNATAIGPGVADFDADTYPDIPYLADSTAIRLTDLNDNSVRPESDTLPLPPGKEADTDNTLMAVGTFNLARQDLTWEEINPGNQNEIDSGLTSLVLGQDNAVIYASYNGDTIFAAGNAADTQGYNDTPPEVVAVPNNGVIAISGFGDVNHDTSQELVFVDKARKLRYVDTSEIGQEKTFQTLNLGSTGGPAVDTGIGLGAPIRFPNGDKFGFLAGDTEPFMMKEKAAVPIVTADNNLALIYKGDTPIYLGSGDTTTGCDCAAPAPVATTSMGLAFMEKGTQKFATTQWDSATVDGASSTYDPVINQSGNRVPGDPERGAVFVYAAAGNPDRNELPCLIENLVSSETVLENLRSFRDSLLRTQVGRYVTSLYYRWFGNVRN